jgi:two-component sensor histidine kinase
MSQTGTAETLKRTAALHPTVMLDDKLLEFVPGAVYVCDLDGVVVRYNRRAGELWGRYPVAGDPQELYCGAHRLYKACGQLMPHNETPMVDALKEGKSFRNIEVQIEQPDGHRLWVLVNIDPLRNDAGEIVGVINCFQDISDRKVSEERQSVLLNELNHRVKNTLSTIQAVATYTFRADSGPEALAKFENRLMALSRAHNVLTDTKWSGAGLYDIVRDTLQCNAGDAGDAGNRLRISGPDIQLKPQLALSMATVLHELYTNAVRYGALSSGEGQVALVWSVTGGAAERTLKLSWQESNGPEVLPPTKSGFGTRVIERSLLQEHQALVDLDFSPSGVRCEIEIPVLEVHLSEGIAGRG